MPRLTPLHYQTLVKVFRKAGFLIDRQTASHIVMNKEGVARPLVIPKYPDVGISIIKGLLRTAGLTRQEFFKLLAD